MCMQIAQANSADLKIELGSEAVRRRECEDSLATVQRALQRATERAHSAENEAERLKADLREAKAKSLRDLEVGTLSCVTYWLAEIGPWAHRRLSSCLQILTLVEGWRWLRGGAG